MSVRASAIIQNLNLKKNTNLSHSNHLTNFQTMKTKNKQHRNIDKAVKEISLAENGIEIARTCDLTTSDLVKYDVIPSPTSYNEGELMT